MMGACSRPVTALSETGLLLIGSPPFPRTYRASPLTCRHRVRRLLACLRVLEIEGQKRGASGAQLLAREMGVPLPFKIVAPIGDRVRFYLFFEATTHHAPRSPRAIA